MRNPRQRLDGAHLYLVCGERADSFLDAALRGGVDVIQLRMKDADDEELLRASSRFARACAANDALFILNDRPDLVAQAGADGVHVGQDDVSAAQAREIVGAQRLVGLSTHTPEQVDDAANLGVDYIGVGPVYATPTKPGRPPVGVGLVRYAAEHFEEPFYAIGGITAGNITAVTAVGADRIAVVRALTESEDPERSARALRQALTATGEHVGAT